MNSDNILVLDQFLPFRLNNLSEIVSLKFAERYRQKYNMTRPEWRALAVLGEQGEMTATSIGRVTRMHKTKVSRAIASLDKRNWVIRKTNPNDRRLEHLMLNARGRSHYSKLVEESKQFESELLEQVGQETLASLWTAIENWEQVGVSSKSIKP